MPKYTAHQGQKAAILIPELHRAILEFDWVKERKHLIRLDGLFPNIIFAARTGEGIYVWIREGNEDQIPLAAKMSAHWIESIRPDRSARIVKSRYPLSGNNAGSQRELSHTTCPEHLLEKLYPQAPKIWRTWHEHLLDETL